MIQTPTTFQVLFRTPRGFDEDDSFTYRLTHQHDKGISNLYYKKKHHLQKHIHLKFQTVPKLFPAGEYWVRCTCIVYALSLKHPQNESWHFLIVVVKHLLTIKLHSYRVPKHTMLQCSTSWVWIRTLWQTSFLFIADVGTTLLHIAWFSMICCLLFTSNECLFRNCVYFVL